MTRNIRDRWDELSPLFDAALDLTETERAVWLEQQRKSDPGLAAALEELLRHEAQLDPERFLSPEVRPGLPAGVGSLAGRMLGPWMLERQLGQGGMGTVWLARRADGRFEGQAAVKLLNLALVSETGQERFRLEGSVLARLTHHGIARLLDAGVSSAGQPFLVLEYVDGQPIDAYVRERKLSQPEILRLFLQVLDAVGHAHANLVVHRDLKPSNIIVAEAGAVKLLDFGIAKLLDVEAGGRATLTADGGRALTPLYAAPEQVTGDPLTTATDVYALGVLLYLLLSGRHPTAREDNTPAEWLTTLLEVEPPRLGLGDLDTILAKALRKPAAERYQTVAVFGEDLERYLRQEPVSARPDALAYRMGKFVRRNRGAVLAGGLTALSLLAATLFSLAQMREARHQRDDAVRQTRRADAQTEFQNVLLSQVGDRPVTMREMIDSGRAVVERQFAHDSVALPALLLQLVASYSELGETKISAVLLARAESLARAGYTDEGLPTIRCRIADNLRMEGKYDEAWQVLADADSMLRRSPDANDSRNCLMYRAALAYEVGKGEEGIATALQAIALMDSLGQTNELEYYNLLSLYASSLENSKPREAETVYRRAIAGMDKSGRGAMLNRTIMRHNLAVVLLKLGHSEEAEEVFREVLDQSVGANPTGVYWQPLIHYAEIALVQDQADTALKYFRHTVRMAVADTNLYWEARGLFGVARAAIRLGNLDEARRAKVRLEQILAKYPHAQDTDDVYPDGATLAGMIALKEGDTAAAWTALRGTLEQHGYFKGKLKSRLRPVALLAADAALDLGKLDDAADLARRAREGAAVDSAADSLSARVGEARLIEGRVVLARGDSAAARGLVTRALAALRHGAGDAHPRTREAEALADALGAPVRRSP